MSTERDDPARDWRKIASDESEPEWARQYALAALANLERDRRMVKRYGAWDTTRVMGEKITRRKAERKTEPTHTPTGIQYVWQTTQGKYFYRRHLRSGTLYGSGFASAREAQVALEERMSHE